MTDLDHLLETPAPRRQRASRVLLIINQVSTWAIITLLVALGCVAVGAVIKVVYHLVAFGWSSVP